MKLSAAPALTAALLALGVPAPVHADPAPVAGTACSGNGRIVPDGNGGEMICTIVATSPAVLTKWKPWTNSADLIVGVTRGAACAPPGAPGRSTDNFAVWCPPLLEEPTWVIFAP
jgi:hypothetical protein